MKQYITIIALIFFMAACSSGGDSDPSPKIDEVAGCTDPGASNYNADADVDNCDCSYEGFAGMTAPPAVATQNVFMEEFKGEWCGNSPDGDVIMDALEAEFPDRLFVSRVHRSDWLANPASKVLNDFFWSSGCPSALVNRVTGVAETRDLWESKARLALDQEAQAQIAIETKITTQTLEGVVYIDFNGELPKTDYRLHLYLTEGNIESIAQENYYSSAYENTEFEGHPYYEKEAVLSGADFVHNNVLKEIIISAHKIGEKAITDGGVYTRKFKVLLGQYNNANLQLVAFVSESSNLKILNVTGVKPGESISW